MAVSYLLVGEIWGRGPVGKTQFSGSEDPRFESRSVTEAKIHHNVPLLTTTATADARHGTYLDQLAGHPPGWTSGEPPPLGPRLPVGPPAYGGAPGRRGAGRWTVLDLVDLSTGQPREGDPGGRPAVKPASRPIPNAGERE
jgi:hypothetical protein